MNRRHQINVISWRLAQVAKDLHDGMQMRVRRCADKADFQVVFEKCLTESLEKWQHEDIGPEKEGRMAAVK